MARSGREVAKMMAWLATAAAALSWLGLAAATDAAERAVSRGVYSTTGI